MYRTQFCNDICDAHIGSRVRLAGWVDVVRDHGGVIFIDLRDYTGVTQVVIHNEELLKNVNRETVISVSGIVEKRAPETVNEKIDTGYVELAADSLQVLGKSKNMLPFEVRSSQMSKDELRLKYRYLDLRNPRNHENIVKRSQIIRYLRGKMEGKDFLEIQTPILTASSPEGARDFLVPSRKHPGKFYALPQAPQQFKRRANFTSWILRWPLPHRKRSLRSVKTSSMIHLRRSPTRKLPQSPSAVSHTRNP